MEKTKICVIPEIQSTFKLHVCPHYINFLESASKSTSRFLCESKAEEGALLTTVITTARYRNKWICLS